jgi:hypothetical protein
MSTQGKPTLKTGEKGESREPRLSGAASQHKLPQEPALGSRVPVAHACNPIYSGGTSFREENLKICELPIVYVNKSES